MKSQSGRHYLSKIFLLTAIALAAFILLLVMLFKQLSTPSESSVPPENTNTENSVSLKSTISKNSAYNNTTEVSANSDSQITQSEETEMTNQSTVSSNSYQEEAQKSADRVNYADNFYYESLTDSVKERIYGLSYKEDCTIPYEDLRYLSLLYCDFDGNTQKGEIICNKAIAEDLIEIFYELYQNDYQIDKIKLIDEYNADDDLSCLDNNTSCFNYRTVAGSTKLSNHAKGLAIDINPFQNPYITYPNGVERISPAGSEQYADRSSGLDHIITEDDLCYKLFIEHGFTWGGHWKSLKDYQHFEKSE